MTLLSSIAALMLSASPEAAEPPNQILAFKNETLLVMDMEGDVVGRRSISTLPPPPLVVTDHPGGALVVLALSETEILVLSPLQLELRREPRAVTEACTIIARSTINRDEDGATRGALGSGNRCD